MINGLSSQPGFSATGESLADSLREASPADPYHPDLKPLLYLVLPQLKKMIDYSSTFIYNSQGQALKSEQFLTVFAGHDVQPLGDPSSQETEELLVQVSLKQLEPLVIEDFWAAPGFNETNRQAEDNPPASPEVRAWCGLRLMSQGQLLGLLVLRHTQKGFFSSEKVRQARFLVGQAISVQRHLWFQAQTVGAFKERQRIARELHDSVTQVLYGIELGINTALTLLDRNSPQVKPQLQEVLALAEAGLAEMRALLTELHPAALETQGLVANLLRQVDALQVRHGLVVTHNLAEEPNLSITLKETLYRVAQEACNNIAKHAHATRVELKLTQTNAYITLEVKDDGCGFDPLLPRPGHLGQQTMRERVRDMGGKLEIISEPGQGTLVRAFLAVP